MKARKEHFGSKFAAIMALAGSAIGLGNIWRFPYMVGQYGGAAFIIVYILCTIFISLPIFLSETMVGRAAENSPIGAMKHFAPGSKWTILGIFCVITPTLISSYYSVVGGWSLGYLFRSCVTTFAAESVSDSAALFASFSQSTWLPLILHTLFLGISAFIILKGVKAGIEKFTKVTMPVLFAVIVILMIYSLMLPGAQAGVDYMIKPDFTKLNGRAIASAMGQSFFSLSLGAGTILTYASYMNKKDNILSSGAWTSFFDLSFALIAGFAVMPAVFAGGIEPAAGPSLVFETLPFIFANIGTVSPILCKIIPILFFLTILFAALTSEISLILVLADHLVDEKHFTRKKATLTVFAICWVVGALCSLSFGPLSGIKILGNNIFGFADFCASNIFMTLCSLGMAIFVGWRMNKTVIQNEFTNNGSINKGLFKILYFLIRFVIPVAILVIFISNFIS